MERTGCSSVALAPFSEHGFFIPDSLEYMEFGRDATGAVTHVIYYQGETVSVHARAGLVAKRQVIKVRAIVRDTYLGRYQL